MDVAQLPRYRQSMERFRTGIAALALIVSVECAAASPCLRKPEPFRLDSDSVTWNVSVKSGADGCLQGLRGKTMTLDSVSVLQQPKYGELLIAGTSFRYIPSLDAKADSFRLRVSGEERRIKGTSEITVEIVVEAP